jgi:MFS family permease
VAIGFFMQSLDATILNTALPAMATELGESPMKMQSVIVAYALTTAMLIPATGWVADRFGTRRVYGWAIGLFVLGSVLCALAQPAVSDRGTRGAGRGWRHDAARGAAGRAAHLSAWRVHSRHELCHSRPGRPLLGPTLGGWMVEYASWHWIFWINVPWA